MATLSIIIRQILITSELTRGNFADHFQVLGHGQLSLALQLRAIRLEHEIAQEPIELSRDNDGKRRKSA